MFYGLNVAYMRTKKMLWCDVTALLRDPGVVQKGRSAHVTSWRESPCSWDVTPPMAKELGNGLSHEIFNLCIFRAPSWPPKTASRLVWFFATSARSFNSSRVDNALWWHYIPDIHGKSDTQGYADTRGYRYKEFGIIRLILTSDKVWLTSV